MKLLVTGQLTLHMGRMEFGNIGNYYIIEPFFRELHRAFPNAEIVTTFQMTEDFSKRERITVLPIDLYYNWNDDVLSFALEEFSIATIYNETNILIKNTPYITEVISTDLFIDLSGDMWGDNADLAGENRFLVGLLKDRIAQLLKIPTVMVGVSPGPFNKDILPLAKIVYENFLLVISREKISKELLKMNNLNTEKTIDGVCPSLLFQAANDNSISKFIKQISHRKKIVGFILCGWNMSDGPYNKELRNNTEYLQFIDTIEYMVKNLNVTVCLLSHSNGFEIQPNFKLIRGRDFLLIKQLYDLLNEEIKEDVFLIDDIYSPSETKAIIGHFDMLITGRVHGAIAALSQSIPTVIIDYVTGPKAHKVKGFAQLFDMEEYICNPLSSADMIEKIKICFKNKEIICVKLIEKNHILSALAKENFNLIKTVYYNKYNEKNPDYCKHNITYIGFSELLIIKLLNHNYFNLVDVITQESRLSELFINELKKKGINVNLISKREDLKYLTNITNTNNILMYKFGYILPKEFVKQFNICNIHSGNLETNRGAHPIGWAILEGMDNTCLSLHKINDKIDLGILIDTYEVKIEPDDDIITLENRLEEGICFILDSYNDYLNGKRVGENITHGIYRSKIKEEDYTINLNKDSSEIISRKIRSQSKYKGAILNFNKYKFYIKSFVDLKEYGVYNDNHSGIK